MAQFDVYRDKVGRLLVDCQSDLLTHLTTRFVVPLIDPASGLRVVSRLNPVFEIEGAERIFFTQYATSMPISEIGKRIGSLDQQRYLMMRALDVLLTGI